MMTIPSTVKSGMNSIQQQEQHHHRVLSLSSPRIVSSPHAATRSEDYGDEDDDNDYEHDDPTTASNSRAHDGALDESASVGPPEHYRDFYLSSPQQIKKTLGTPPPRRKGPRGGVLIPFPVKLHEMLTNCQFDGNDRIVSWLPHGRAFAIHEQNEFVAKLQPLYFKQGKITSFQRQLNLYGFVRKTDGEDRGSYYHELFLRGRPDLAKIIVRKRVKGGDTRRRNMIEPDFYKMPFCPDDPDPRKKPPPPREVPFPLHHHSRTHVSPPHAHSSPRRFPRIQRRALYNDDRLTRTPRIGYSCPPYAYTTPEHRPDVHDEVVASEEQQLSPDQKKQYSRPPWGPVSRNSALPSSAFFLDDEPLLHAPEDSEWTPPPFPELRTQNPQRERPPPQVIQPSYYPNVISPVSTDHHRSNVKSGVAPSSNANSGVAIASERVSAERSRAREQATYSPRPQAREEQVDYHRYHRRPRVPVRRVSPRHHHWDDQYEEYYYRRAQYYRQFPFRVGGSREPGPYRYEYYDGHHYEPIDEGHPQMLESDIPQYDVHYL